MYQDLYNYVIMNKIIFEGENNGLHKTTNGN